MQKKLFSNRAKTAQIVLSILLLMFIVLAAIPYINRQTPKLEQNVACFKSICVDDGTTVTCDSIPPQVGYYQIVHERTGSSLSVTLTGKACF